MPVFVGVTLLPMAGGWLAPPRFSEAKKSKNVLILKMFWGILKKIRISPLWILMYWVFFRNTSVFYNLPYKITFHKRGGGVQKESAIYVWSCFDVYHTSKHLKKWEAMFWFLHYKIIGAPKKFKIWRVPYLGLERAMYVLKSQIHFVRQSL